MKATNFRLDNLVIVNHRYDRLCRVKWLQHDSVSCEFVKPPDDDLVNGIIVSPQSIRPVPISIEWLMESGCTVPDKDDKFGGVLSPVWGENQERLRFRGNDGNQHVFYYSPGKFGQPVVLLWVHQYQNFFFGLTGQELKFKKYPEIGVCTFRTQTRVEFIYNILIGFCPFFVATFFNTGSQVYKTVNLSFKIKL